MRADPSPHLAVQPNFGLPGQRHRHAYTPGDDFFARLIAAHDGLDDDASQALNARLVLLLANHIGDPRVLDEALALARRSLGAGDDDVPNPATDTAAT